MSDVVNLQRKLSIDLSSVRQFVSGLSEEVEEISGHTFTVAFVSDRRMKQLNQFFRGKDSTTDVLSFPWSEPLASAGQLDEDDAANLPPAHAGGSDLAADSQPAPAFLGDIVISAEQAERQAKENKLTLDREIKQLILHGMLHLCGYDHETDSGEMNARELELREKLGI